jgi:exodeoxyribonuclease VII small subunit
MSKNKDPQLSPTPASYEAAYEELEGIMEALQEDEISVDDLATKVQRAAGLLNFCSERLRKTEGAVQKIVEQLGG